MAVTTAVLDTYELLEGILIYLSPTEMTKVMRVSKKWHELILSSPLRRVARTLISLDMSGLGDHLPNTHTLVPLYDADTCITYSNPDILKPASTWRGSGLEEGKEYSVHLIEIGS